MCPDPLEPRVDLLTLGDRLRQHRQQYGMTQTYFATLVDLPVSVVQQIESQRIVWLSLPRQQRLAAVLGCACAALGLPTSRPRRPAPDAPAVVGPPPGERSPATVGARVRAWREHRGWTQQQLADRLDLHVTALSRLECGRVTRPQALLVARLARALGCTPRTLLGSVPRRTARAGTP